MFLIRTNIGWGTYWIILENYYSIESEKLIRGVELSDYKDQLLIQQNEHFIQLMMVYTDDIYCMN